MREVFEVILKILEHFFKSIGSIFSGVFNIFNFGAYIRIFNQYSSVLNFGEWLLVVFFLVIIFDFIAICIILLIHYIRKFVRFRKSQVIPQDLIDEVARLQLEVNKVTREKDRILALKVESLGLPKSQTLALDDAANSDVETNGESRFYKLKEIDKEYAEVVPQTFNDEISLDEFCTRFRDYACNKLHLYYDIRIIRLFVAGLSTTRLIILQGISGTGKTSLPYAFGKFLGHDALIAPVQPSWRDRTELFGYFNEFTKRFNETEVLRAMYEATYSNEVFVTVLDEMNIARVEYYFAEMLSIFEMPSQESWIVDLAPSGWDTDPKHIIKGRFKLPTNMWFVGTANNDDSTFAISDKVYDRAIPININSKGIKFDAPETEEVKISSERLTELFKEAIEKYKVSPETLSKIEELDNYVIEHFRLAFGNRIVKQLAEFIPAYCGCGGTELDGLDYVLANKIFRKFEGLNLSFIRDEFDGLIDYLHKLFGEDAMGESVAYINLLKKLF